MRKPKSKRDKELAEEDWEACKCSKYLLTVIEAIAAPLNAKVRDAFPKNSAGHSSASLAISAFTVCAKISDDPADNCNLHKEIVEIAFHAPLPKMKFSYGGNVVTDGPLAGEIAARTFLKAATFLYSDMKENKVNSWTYVEHGNAITESWIHWQNWAQRWIDGGSYAAWQDTGSKQIAGIFEAAAASKESKRYGDDNNAGTIKRNEIIRAWIAALSPNLSNRQKAEKAEKHFKTTPYKLSAERIRKLLKMGQTQAN